MREGAQVTATISTDKERIGVELYASNDSEKTAFRSLLADKETIEREFGERLEWQELSGKKASRIALYRHGVNASKTGTEYVDHAAGDLERAPSHLSAAVATDVRDVDLSGPRMPPIASWARQSYCD